MKTLLLILSTLTFGLNCLGQTPRQLTKTDSTQIEMKVEIETLKLKDSLGTSGQQAENLLLEFTIDTFKIEERQRLKLEIDYSTNGMVISTLDANRAYDKLLNKYYQLLLKNLNEEDKEILKKSQRNWIEFRDSEFELNSVLINDYYSGGGTIQRVFAASRVLELTRDRVIVFYHYLDRKME